MEEGNGDALEGEGDGDGGCEAGFLGFGAGARRARADDVKSRDDGPVAGRVWCCRARR